VKLQEKQTSSQVFAIDKLQFGIVDSHGVYQSRFQMNHARSAALYTFCITQKISLLYPV
jgi:hypothetical protein